VPEVQKKKQTSEEGEAKKKCLFPARIRNAFWRMRVSCNEKRAARGRQPPKRGRTSQDRKKQGSG